VYDYTAQHSTKCIIFVTNDKLYVEII